MASINAVELATLFRIALERLRTEIDTLSPGTQLWRPLPGVTNSAGNLVLHLEGNLREYIGRQLGRVDYERRRPLEFSTRDLPLDELVSRIAWLQQLIPAVVEALTSSQLDEQYPETVLDKPTTVRYLLIHLHGHLMYHVGQINYIRRIAASAQSSPHS